ncbi:MAG: DUF342 domain-containing protein, partial [Desulfovibrio sp.]|nr:DUF342 domain-containing protein [Desulfovibrio sp.]
MKYYLRHYFNPDFNHLHPKPALTDGSDGSSDLYSLGYVQNAIDGQVLAEIVPLDQAGEDVDPRFIQNEPTLP